MSNVGFLANTGGGEIFTLHRLDLNVGGVMVYARSKAMAAKLSRVIQDGAMKKEYVAMVHGVPPAFGDWEDLLWKDTKKNKVFVVKRERKGVKKARLEYERISSTHGQREAEAAGDGGADAAQSLVQICLHTGRSHQIRVQFASRGYPLVGDHKYGARDKIADPMLFSCRLTFPYQGRMVSFEAFPQWVECP